MLARERRETTRKTEVGRVFLNVPIMRGRKAGGGEEAG
jgi:hypothetical protein